jgi:uncharacterized protein YkwD
MRRREARRTDARVRVEVHGAVRLLLCLPVVIVIAACAVGARSVAAANRDDVIALVNRVRLEGCPTAAAAATGLESDRSLDSVAARVRRGSSLADATRAEAYPAQRSASIDVTSATSSAALEALLESPAYCRIVTDRDLVRVGVAGRGNAATIVLAAPFSAPVVGANTAALRVLELVNDARSRPRSCGGRRYNAASPLKPDATLDATAAAHAKDMARHGKMTHDGADGSTPAERATRAGYPWRFVAENVAAGQTTAEEVVATWIASPGHCANIMNPELREMGIAFAFHAASADGTYWAQVLATRK